MRSVLALLLFSACLVLAAQDRSLIPELKADLATAKDDTTRADVLARICFNLIRSDPDSARLVGDQALALAKRIKNPKALGDAHNNLGWLSAEKGEFRRADSLLNIALGIFKGIGKPEYISVTLSNLGWVSEKKGDSVASLKRFQEALTMSEQAKDSASTAKLLYSIGISYRKVGDHKSGLEYLERSLAMERALGRTNAEGNCLVGIANTYRELHDTAAAIRAFEEADRLFVVLKDHYGRGLIQENLGDMERERATAKALHHYALALAHYDTIDSPVDKAYVLLSFGKAELLLKDARAAAEHLERGAGFARDAGDRQLSMNYERALAELASLQGDAKGTFAHYSRYAALKDSLQGEDTQRELARLRTAFETERKEKDNAILRAENNEKTERLRSKDLQLYGSIAIGLLAFFAAVLFFRNYRQKRKHAEVLEGLNAQLASNNAEITEINGLLEMKVLRSQMNPHFIYNCLNSAARMTQAGQTTEALSYLQGFARLLRMVLDQSVKDRITINEEIDFLQQYLKLEAYRLEGLRYEVIADEELLDDEVELPALLVQPFVENAVWHGLVEKQGERSLSVRFERENGWVLCSITDNGIGRNGQASKAKADPQHRSLGMQLTSERLRLLARRMEETASFAVEDLKSGDGSAAGTRVTLRLPVDVTVQHEHAG
jgi:hypothetical protein